MKTEEKNETLNVSQEVVKNVAVIVYEALKPFGKGKDVNYMITLLLSSVCYILMYWGRCIGEVPEEFAVRTLEHGVKAMKEHQRENVESKN